MTKPSNGKPQSATIIGQGQGGMHLAFGLLQQGWDVTLVSDRTPEQMLASPAMASHGLHTRSMEFEAEAGIDVYKQMIEHPQKGIEFKISTDGRTPVVDIYSYFVKRMRAVDSRLKTALLLEEFERRGGTIRYERATVEDLETFAEKGPVFMATGKGELGKIFEEDEERSTVDKPQRTILLLMVEGMEFDGPEDTRYSSVNFSFMPGKGELFYAPNIHFQNKPVHITLAEAVPGSDVDRISEIENADDALRIFKELVDVMCSWHSDAFAPSTLADPKGWLAGAVRPQIRKPVATLPSGKSVYGIGDVVIVNDPIAGQGGNCTAYGVWHLLGKIKELDGAPVDPDFFADQFNSFYETRGRYFTEHTNRLLNPPDPALAVVMDAAAEDQSVADRLVDAFREPWEFIPRLGSVEEAEALVEEARQQPARTAAPV